MSNKNKLTILEKRKSELVRQIHTCAHHKKKITNLVNELSIHHHSDRISYSEYDKRLSLALDNKKPEDWINYYDEKIIHLNTELRGINENIIKEESRINIAPLVIVFAVLVLLGIGVYYMQPTITGLVIQEGTISFDRNVDCHQCSPHKAPPTQEINMTITVEFEGEAEDSILVEYYPINWTILNENGGEIEEYNEEYNKITWTVNGESPVIKTYIIESPELVIPPMDYYFNTQIENIISDDWRIKISDKPGKIQDGGSFPITDSSIPVGSTTTASPTLTTISAADAENWDIFIEDASSNRITDLCGGNQIIVTEVTENHANCAPASSNAVHNDYVDCNNLGASQTVDVTYTIEGCAAGGPTTYNLEISTDTAGQKAFTGTDTLTVTAVNNAPNNPTGIIINSTNTAQTNYTTEDIQVRFNVSDPNVGDTLTYNITWFTNNITNFTLKNIAINNPGIGIENLTHQNTTKYDNWSAQIVVCDDSNACSDYVNTSALYIKNINASITIPAFNQSTFNNLQIINVSVLFSDDDGDSNSITFEWFKNDILIRRTTNSNLANGTNTTDVLTSASFTINDQIIVQAFAFDGERNSSLLNSTTLTITSDNSAPNDPTPLINSTLATNLSAQDLNVYFTPTDPDAGETLTYNIWIYENGSRLFNISNLQTTQDLLQVFIINAENTTKGNNYSAQIEICDDSSVCSDYVNTSQLNITNTGPQITNVSINSAWSVTVDGNTSTFFSFSVVDDDNYTDIDVTNILANFSRGGETTRYNNTDLDGGCKQSGSFGIYIANYTCTINLVFYDGAGDWNVSLMLNDKSLNYTMNNTATFNLAETTSFSLSDASFTFPGAAPNVYNITTLDAIYMNNTGNDDINASGINITAVDIYGDTDGIKFIPAANFTISTSSDADKVQCGLSTAFMLGNKSISETTQTNSTLILGASLTAAVKPNNEETLFLCLLHTPSDLTSQTYSTNAEEDWSIIIN